MDFFENYLLFTHIYHNFAPANWYFPENKIFEERWFFRKMPRIRIVPNILLLLVFVRIHFRDMINGCFLFCSQKQVYLLHRLCNIAYFSYKKLRISAILYCCTGGRVSRKYVHNTQLYFPNALFEKIINFQASKVMRLS